MSIVTARFLSVALFGSLAFAQSGASVDTPLRRSIQNLGKRGLQAAPTSRSFAPKQIWAKPPQVAEPASPCAIRLTEMPVKEQGKIKVFKPQTQDSGMPSVKLPAPPCPRDSRE
jgi:hypothetical protein